jgi:hypothetical protein
VLEINTSPALKSPISYLSQIEIVSQSWGYWAPAIYYAAIFINFLFCIWLLDYGCDAGWGFDLSAILSISAMFIPIMIGVPAIWLLSKSG